MAEPIQRPTYRITDLPENERLRERLAQLGPQVLSNAELLAILLRVGVQGENAVHVGERLLADFKGLRGLHHAPFEELCHQRGIGEARPRRSRLPLNWAAGWRRRILRNASPSTARRTQPR